MKCLLLLALLPLAGCTENAVTQASDGEYIIAASQQSPWDSMDSLKRSGTSKAQEHCGSMGLNPRVVSFEKFTGGDPTNPLSGIRTKFVCS